MKIQDLKSGDKLLLQIYSESQTDDGGMRLCTFGHLDGMHSYITIDGVEGHDKVVHLGAVVEVTKRDGEVHKLYTLQGDRVGEYYVLANSSVEDEFMKVFTEATGAKFVDVTPIDQYKCPSYFDDLGELKDCSCGKCDVQLIL